MVNSFVWQPVVLKTNAHGSKVPVLWKYILSLFFSLSYSAQTWLPFLWLSEFAATSDKEIFISQYSTEVLSKFNNGHINRETPAQFSDEAFTPRIISSEQVFPWYLYHSCLSRYIYCFLALYLLDTEGANFHLYCYLMLTAAHCVVNAGSILTQQTGPSLGQHRWYVHSDDSSWISWTQ